MMENVNMIDLTPLVQAVIALAAALITMYLIPWIKSRTTVEQQQHIKTAVQVAVYAAEKAYGAGHGDEKLAYAEKVLAGYNVRLDTQKLRALIDAQIKEMEQAEALLPIEGQQAEDDEAEGEVGADAGEDTV